MKKIYNNFKKLVLLILITSQILNITGCTGNRKEVQKLSLVVAVGIDLNSDGKIQVTMQVLNPASSSTQTGETATESAKGEVLIYSAKADTFYDAVYQASKTMGKIQHFGHTKYIVINEKLAEDGIKPLIDSFVRLEEFRLNTPLLVTRGRAEDIVSAKTKENIIPADTVQDIFLRQENVAYRPFSYLLDIIDTLTSKTTSPVLAIIELVRPEEKLGSETFKIAGTAVFKKDKLVGYLDDKQTRGLNWIRGMVEVGSVTFLCPSYGKTSVEILRSSSKIKVLVKEDSITINLLLKNSSSLRRIEKPIDPVKKVETLYILEQAEDTAIREEVMSALDVARNDFGTDIFGFGDKVHAAYPKEWKALEKDWETLYRNMNINITVDSKIRATGATLKSIK